MSETTKNMTVPSIVPVTTKQTDYKDLKTGEDHRAPATVTEQIGPRDATGA